MKLINTYEVVTYFNAKRLSSRISLTFKSNKQFQQQKNERVFFCYRQPDCEQSKLQAITQHCQRYPEWNSVNYILQFK